MENIPEDLPVETIYLIGDTETAGLGEYKKACEVAFMQIDPVSLAPLQRWQSLIDCECDIQEGAQAIHGISREMLQDEPTMDEFVEHRLGGRFKQDIVLIGHNISFDLPLLTPIGNIVRTLCTLKHARNLVKDSDNHKLQTLREHFGIPPNDAHRAMADVEVTRKVLENLLRISGRTLLQLIATPGQVVHTMPFGKHKGTPIIQLPKDYLKWFVDTMKDVDADLMASFKKALKAK